MKRKRRAARPMIMVPAAAALCLVTALPGLASADDKGALQVTQPAKAGTAARVDLSALTSSLREHYDVLHAGKDDEFKPSGAAPVEAGNQHIRYNRFHQGILVLGGEVIVHTDAFGRFSSATTPISAPVTVGTSPKLDAAQAQLKSGAARTAGTSTLVIDASGAAQGKAPVLAWLVSDRSAPETKYSLVDAQTGGVRFAWKDAYHLGEGSIGGIGRGLVEGTVPLGVTLSGDATQPYELRDPLRGNTRVLDVHNATGRPQVSAGTPIRAAQPKFGDGTPQSRDSGAADAMYGAQQAYDFFTNVLGRNGVKDDGSGSTVLVHAGTDAVLGYWDTNEKAVVLGDGAPGNPIASTDAVAHELMHGAVENMGNIYLSPESAAIREGTSDIFGTAAEFYADNPNDPGDYVVAERSAQVSRYMYQPSKDGHGVDCWSPEAWLKDEHDVGGVANHAFYLMAEGSNSATQPKSPTCNKSLVTGIGRDKAVQIFYRALQAYSFDSEDFRLLRIHTLLAASDLYGTCSTEYAAVQKAWSAVNVAAEDSPCTSNSPSPLRLVNSTKTVIPDAGQAVSSDIKVVAFPLQTKRATVSFRIFHTYRGDLEVNLIRPDGSVVPLHPAGSSPADNLFMTASVGLPANGSPAGTWRLSVKDRFKNDLGYLGDWSLVLQK